MRGAFLSLFTLSAVAQTQCSVTLAWDSDSGDNIAGYNLYYGPGSLTYTNMIQVGDVTQATVTNLCPGATYYFAITAVDASGTEAGYSGEIVYTVPRALAALQLRVVFTGQAIPDARNVTLAWDPDSGDNIAGYNVYYGPGSLTYTNMFQFGDVAQVTVTNLCPGATYYFAITSVDAAGAESGYSAELIYAVPRVLATLQLRVTSTGQAIPDARNLTLAWDPDPGDNIAGYNVYYGLSSLTYANVIQVGDLTQVTVTNLCPGTTYYFAITSVDGSGAESGYSAELIYTLPLALATLQLRVTPTGQAILDATGPAGQSYDILAAPSLGSWTNLGTMTLGADGTSEFIDSTVAGQPSCFYRLRGK